MSDPLADFTNLSQDEHETEQPTTYEQDDQRRAEIGQQMDDDVQIPQEQEQYEATENAEYPEYFNQYEQNDYQVEKSEDGAYTGGNHQDQEDGEDNEDQIDPQISQQQREPREEAVDEDEVIRSMRAQRLTSGEPNYVQVKNIRKTRTDVPRQAPAMATSDSFDEPQVEVNEENMDPQARRRYELEEKMNAAIKKKPTSRRKKTDDIDLDKMEDGVIQDMRDRMFDAANIDVEKNTQGQVATEKMKMLDEAMSLLSRADLAESIVENQMLKAIRTWLEPLPDASMPAYQIQKELIHALESLPVNTDALRQSNLGKVLVFYQRSRRTPPNLKKIVDRLIGDWTRPILNRSDSYKDRSIQFGMYDKTAHSNKMSKPTKKKETKTLYEQNAERRKRAAIPTARTAAYKIAPKVDKSLLMRQAGRAPGYDERFRSINSKITAMTNKKKAASKGGVSIEGRDMGV
ncbi:uncharacterized protein LODBEIA_P04910 [Lodderomyces beijingensis]|uniref:TFIIS N-terminal domain-containing protein n=1 Tax=Lodderomyces beijingensis TaxID=1775926 RepID=A0ABP0ZDM5_9ASCO